jgi:D-threo-aldose 1-dehydrogenase
MQLPKVIFGTSALGNLYTALADEVKCAIVGECVKHSPKPAVFDTAGKYGAGLALESLGKCLADLNVEPDKVIISNKLGWFRTELKTSEPTFEPGVWKDLRYDAEQRISYDGILACYRQGNQLLNGYQTALVSVHDPDDYINSGTDEQDKAYRYRDILDAYQALGQLKDRDQVKAVGIGSKDWKMIRRISLDVDLDWVMFANSMTIHDHPAELIGFMKELQADGVTVINSAVFNGGFLTGSPYYNYRLTDPEEDRPLYEWREQFNAVCKKYSITPAVAAVAFGLQAPGVQSIALNTTDPARVAQNIAMADARLPDGFWDEMRVSGLIDTVY